VGGSPTHPPATKALCRLNAPAQCNAGAGDPPCIISCVYSGNYTPQPQSGCSLGVAIATAGRLRKPQKTLARKGNFFSKIAARQRNIFAKLKKEKRKIKKKKTKSIVIFI